MHYPQNNNNPISQSNTAKLPSRIEYAYSVPHYSVSNPPHPGYTPYVNSNAVIAQSQQMPVGVPVNQWPESMGITEVVTPPITPPPVLPYAVPHDYNPDLNNISYYNNMYSIPPPPQSYPSLTSQPFPISSSPLLQQNLEQQQQMIDRGIPLTPMAMNYAVGLDNDTSNSIPTGTTYISEPGKTAGKAKPATDHGWTEHLSDDGRRYYYNRKLNRSQWEKPLELRGPNDPITAVMGWKEYTTAEGKTYWHNKNTKASTWEIPEEIRKLNEANETSDHENYNFEGKEEASVCFKKFIARKRILTKMNWENVQKILERDDRWTCFKILSRGEKKQLYSEYTTQQVKRNLTDGRKKAIESRKSMLEALKTWKDLNIRSTFIDFVEKFHDASWWAYLKDAEKDELFQEQVDELEKQWLTETRRNRKTQMDELCKIIEETPNITGLMTYYECREILKDNPAWKALSATQTLEVWQTFCQFEEKRYKEIQRRNLYRLERRRRDAFKALLNSLVESDILHSHSTWVEIMAIIHEKDEYLAMVGQSGSVPHEEFDIIVESLQERYVQDKTIIRDLVKARGIQISVDSEYEWFYEQIKDDESLNKIKIVNLKFIFKSLHQRVLEEERKLIEKDKTLVEKARTFFDRVPGLSQINTWAGVLNLINADDSISEKHKNLDISDNLLEKLFATWQYQHGRREDSISSEEGGIATHCTSSRPKNKYKNTSATDSRSGSRDRNPGDSHKKKYKNKNKNKNKNKSSTVSRSRSPDRNPGDGHKKKYKNKNTSATVSRSRSPDRNPGDGHKKKNKNKNKSATVSRSRSPDRNPGDGHKSKRSGNSFKSRHSKRHKRRHRSPTRD